MKYLVKFTETVEHSVCIESDLTVAQLLGVDPLPDYSDVENEEEPWFDEVDNVEDWYAKSPLEVTDRHLIKIIPVD